MVPLWMALSGVPVGAAKSRPVCEPDDHMAPDWPYVEVSVNEARGGEAARELFEALLLGLGPGLGLFLQPLGLRLGLRLLLGLLGLGLGFRLGLGLQLRLGGGRVLGRLVGGLLLGGGAGGGVGLVLLLLGLLEDAGAQYLARVGGALGGVGAGDARAGEGVAACCAGPVPVSSGFSSPDIIEPRSGIDILIGGLPPCAVAMPPAPTAAMTPTPRTVELRASPPRCLATRCLPRTGRTVSAVGFQTSRTSSSVTAGPNTCPWEEA